MKQFTYLGETFSYSVIPDFDCDDFDFHTGEQVTLLRVNFTDGLKVRLYAELAFFEDSVPSFVYPTIKPEISNIGQKHIEVVQYLLKKHNLPLYQA